MKLIDLDPRWLSFDQGRRGQGISFKCPCCKKIRIVIPFSNPLDGGPQVKDRPVFWEREGDDFANLTITPSIDGSQDGHWHGHIRKGVAT